MHAKYKMVFRRFVEHKSWQEDANWPRMHGWFYVIVNFKFLEVNTHTAALRRYENQPVNLCGIAPLREINLQLDQFLGLLTVHPWQDFS